MNTETTMTTEHGLMLSTYLSKSMGKRLASPAINMDAVLVDYRCARDDSRAVVICILPGNRMHRYAVWWCQRGEHGAPVLDTGGYHSTLSDASDDMDDRNFLLAKR